MFSWCSLALGHGSSWKPESLGRPSLKAELTAHTHSPFPSSLFSSISLLSPMSISFSLHLLSFTFFLSAQQSPSPLSSHSLPAGLPAPLLGPQLSSTFWLLIMSSRESRPILPMPTAHAPWLGVVPLWQALGAGKVMKAQEK